MKTGKITARRVIYQRILFSAVVLFAVVVQAFFFANIVQWRNAPDQGWFANLELGPKIVSSVTKTGEKSGLKPMDKILELNGKSYETYDELKELRGLEIGQENEYLIERDGEVLTIRVTSTKMGWRRVSFTSGLFWALGLIFLGIGTIVFLMKPYHGPSWAFLIMTLVLSIYIPYSSPSFFFTPPWLNNLMIFLPPLLPASIIHLAILFPQRRSYFADRWWLLAVPYLASLTLAVIWRSHASRIAMVPYHLLTVGDIYLFTSILMFLASTIYSYIKSTSVAMRLQSLVIFTGLTLGFFIPVFDVITNIIFKVAFFPNPIFFYLFFLTFFPLSIGYAIVRHDLFEVDTIVRRTYGYLLSTAAIIIAYASIVSVLNVTFRSSDFTKSPFFSIAFALFIVIFFEPLHRKIQNVVDRLFHRQKYDYRKAIRSISETMTSILDAEAVHRTLVGSVVKEMVLENGVLLLPNPAGEGYRVEAVEGVDTKEIESEQLENSDVLMEAIREKGDVIFMHEIELNPRYEDTKEALQKTMDSFSSELMIPMKYEDEIKGIVSLGPKKSGKMFTLEDIDLLKTMINQSVIAMENAKLIEENIEKSRMEEELKIAHDLQMSMLPETAPEIEGLKVAALSLPAREVGGDFYDFIMIPGNGSGDKLAVIVGDVSGKAVSGALVMAASRSTYRVLAEAHKSVEQIMRTGNHRLTKDISKGMFVALVYAVLDPKDRSLVLSNAGQTQPILVGGGESKPSYIDTEGDRFPLGIIEDCEYQETRVTLNKGDTVVFYTDGIVEAMNEKEEMYGFDRFMETIDEGKGLEPDDLLEKLMKDVSGFVGDMDQHDDLTVVVVKMD